MGVYMPEEVPGGVIMRCIRLVVADRQPIVLCGLKSVFTAQHNFEIVASCSDGKSCLEGIRKLKPDIALLAGTLPDLTASEMLAIAKAERISTRLVFFTGSESDVTVTLAVAAGTCNALSKFENVDTLLQSLTLIAGSGKSPKRSRGFSSNAKSGEAS